MTKIAFAKHDLTIAQIGSHRFWTGILAGAITAIAIALGMNYTREVFRMLTMMSADLLIVDPAEQQFYNYFFAALATVFGLSVCIWVWLSNHQHKRGKDRIYKQLARTNALLIFWVVLMLIARFGSMLYIILYGVAGYDNQLDPFQDYAIVFILLPIIVFAQSWYAVRLAYRAGRWIFISCLACILSVLILEKTSSVDQSIVNNAYFKRYEQEYQYIAKEVSNTQILYGVEFDPETVVTLKKWYTTTSLQQVKHVKEAFSKDRAVSIDTMILQKIIIRNFKRSNWYVNHYNRPQDNWQYALPKEIIQQLAFYDVKAKETKVLFEILKEQIDLVNTPKFNWQNDKKLSFTERRKRLNAPLIIPNTIRYQLKEVRDSLLKDARYTNYAKELPAIQLDVDRPPRKQ